MLVSTALNLIVVPAMYIIIDDFGARLGKIGARFTDRARKPAVAGKEA